MTIPLAVDTGSPAVVFVRCMLLKKLVIAEDDDAVAHLVAASLGDAGFLCLRARDVEEALNIVRSELPDSLLIGWLSVITARSVRTGIGSSRR